VFIASKEIYRFHLLTKIICNLQEVEIYFVNIFGDKETNLLICVLYNKTKSIFKNAVLKVSSLCHNTGKVINGSSWIKVSELKWKVLFIMWRQQFSPKSVITGHNPVFLTIILCLGRIKERVHIKMIFVCQYYNMVNLTLSIDNVRNDSLFPNHRISSAFQIWCEAFPPRKLKLNPHRRKHLHTVETQHSNGYWKLLWPPKIWKVSADSTGTFSE
jgi:hypothetical protein